MSDTVLVALITGGFTLLSGLLAVVLTHRYSKSQAEAARRDERRRDVRALVAQFVNAGAQWAATHDVLVPIYFKNAGDKQFWLEWPDTDSGRALRENALTVERTAGELVLIVSDPQLLDGISRALEMKADGKPMEALLDDSRRSGGTTWTDGVMATAFAHYRAVGEAFRAVEHRASELLRGQL